jgi:hypothetical protein
MVQRTWGVVACALYMAWAALAMTTITLAPALRTGSLQYSLRAFIALHPAIPPASVPAIFDLGRTATTAAFAAFAVLTAASAVLLFRLHEWGRRSARILALIGMLAAVFVAPVRSLAGAVTVAAVVTPYALIFLYLGRDYIHLRFQMAKESRPAPRFFRQDN